MGCENVERKSCQNATMTVECRNCAKPAKMRLVNAETEGKLQKCDGMRERGAGAGCENAERKSCQNATIKCRDCAKPAKICTLNEESERKLQKCDCMRESVAGVGWENLERGKAAKTQPSNVEIMQNLPKHDRQMQRFCKTYQNVTVECGE